MLSSVERINPYLIVKDIGESLNYYVKILGFEKYMETPHLGIVERDGHQIHLMRSQEEQPAHRVWIGVENISILFNQYRKKGVKFFQEPTNFS